MRKKHWKKMWLTVCSLFIASMVLSSVMAKAAETAETLVDDTSGPGEDELTQTFYMPKAMFRTDSDYADYCQRMYQYGYMDSNYNWTDSAQSFIANQTMENAQKAGEEAKAIVQQRVEDGEINEEDNPYLTYDEVQQVLKKKAEQASEQSTGDGSQPEYIPDTTEAESDYHDMETEPQEGWPDIEETEKESETEQVKEQTGMTLGTIISYVIIAIFICAAGLIGYWIYRRQF